MKKQSPALLSLLASACFLQTACNNTTSDAPKNQSDKTNVLPTGKSFDFPKVVDLDSTLKSTDFLVSSDQAFPLGKNVVYTPTLLLTWEQILTEFEHQIQVIKPISEDFRLLNSNKTFADALDKTEYDAEVEKTNMRISVCTRFKKLLPFKVPFEPVKQMQFKGSNVKGFGSLNRNMDLMKTIDILYYKDDKEFIIKINPQDETQEIIFVKGDKRSKNFDEVLANIKQKQSLGEAERQKSSDKYSLTVHDKVLIPAILFNIKKTFHHIEGQAFTDKAKQRWDIVQAEQRNAFSLDEHGAKAESEAKISAIAESAQLTPTKELILDNDFYVFLKKKNSSQPYYAIKIINEELLVK